VTPIRLSLYGGFGEKGRTCLGVEAAGFRLLLDAGVKTSALGTRDYHPAIAADAIAALDAIVITHAHEDHVAALGWCLAQGFRGRILMTAETRREADESLAGYATAAERALVQASTIESIAVGEALRLGPFDASTGRAGHMGGSVWMTLAAGGIRLGYCGDTVPQSLVFAADPMPGVDTQVLDASYGDDDTPYATRAAAVRAWIAAHPAGAVLPTPRFGRSAELAAIVDTSLALAPGMRDALAAQRDGATWLRPGIAEALDARLRGAVDWQVGDALPRAALVCDDGMGLAGSSKVILAEASARGHPTLFTGHLPDGSPGARMVEAKRADWIRLPTHPTLAENRALADASGAARLIGHSCDAAALARMSARLPRLDASLRTGMRVDL
jgi:Cft2 family RNA processing exonuclease